MQKNSFTKMHYMISNQNNAKDFLYQKINSRTNYTGKSSHEMKIRIIFNQKFLEDI